MSAPMYLVADDLPGRLWIMPCPDGARLQADVGAYRTAGMTHLVTLQPKEEAAQLGLSDERAACAQAGIAFHRHPIVDFGLPQVAAFGQLTTEIAQWVMQGAQVGVHCRAGIGRSGMVVAGVLIEMGHCAQAAVQTVTTARGVSIPDTVEQGNFIASFANLRL